jgi:hypothetical protein
MTASSLSFLPAQEINRKRPIHRPGKKRYFDRCAGMVVVAKQFRFLH